MEESPKMVGVDFPDVGIEYEDGWGPSEKIDRLDYLPVTTAMFNKNDNILVSDWYKSYGRSKFNSRHEGTGLSESHSSLKKMSGFEFIAHGKQTESKKGVRKGYRQIVKAKIARQHQRDKQKLRREAEKVETGARTFGGFARDRRNKWQKRRNQQYKARQAQKNENQHKFDPSTQVLSTWQHKDDLWLPDMKDMKYTITQELAAPTLLAEIGQARVLRSGLVKIKTHSPKKLKSSQIKYEKRHFRPIRTDPQMLSYEDEGDVFMSSGVMAALMTCRLSIMAFHLNVHKTDDGKLWFELPEDSPLRQIRPDEGVAKYIIKDSKMENFAKTISKEATNMDRAFHYLALDKKKQPIRGKHGAGERLQGVLSSIYRYKKFDLEDYSVVCRCHFDAFDSTGEACLVATATQHDPGRSYSMLDMNKELDNKFSATRTALVTNNKFQFNRWAAEAVLTDTPLICLGFAAREYPKTAQPHHLLKVLKIKKKDFAQSWARMKNMENAWGSLDNIIQFMRHEERESGKYVILRDPNRDKLQFYKVDDFEASDDRYVYGTQV